jgi:hypothetical protein
MRPALQCKEMLKFKSLPVFMGVLAVVLWARPTDASIVQALELEELIDRADQILLGTVVFSESFEYPNGTIGTAHRVLIERDVSGRSLGEPEVIVETLGGQIGDLAMRIEGEPRFDVGERVVVFVRGAGDYLAFRPVGMGQGVMRVRTVEGVDRVRQTQAGMMLMRRNAQGVLQKSQGALPKEERLDTFLDRVRSLIERNAGDSNE